MCWKEEEMTAGQADGGGQVALVPAVGLIPDGMPGWRKTVYTNPATLFFTPKEEARRWTDILIACGADAGGTLAGGIASDFDRWAALCRAMPLLAGHPLYMRVHVLLETAFGWKQPLCPRTAAVSWAFCAEKLCAETCTPPVLAALCGAAFCPALFPDREGHLWDGVTDLTTLRTALAAGRMGGAVEQPASGPAVWMLPDGYSFARPDPYRAQKYVQAVVHGGQAGPGTVVFGDGPLAEGEGNLLLTQLIRTDGCLGREAGQSLSLCGRWEAIQPLITYLDEADCLPDTVCWVKNPESLPAGADFLLPMGYARCGDSRRDGSRNVRRNGSRNDRGWTGQVSVGLWLDGGADPETVAGKLTAYAARFPLGASPGVRISVHTVADIAQVAVLRRTLTHVLERWAAGGAGPTDPQAQADLVARLTGGRAAESP